MPDQWGRFNMDDGFAIARTLNNANYLQAQKREREEEQSRRGMIYAAANAIKTGADKSIFPDEALYEGAKLVNEENIRGYQSQIQEHLASDAGRQEAISRAEQKSKMIGTAWNEYQGYRRSGQDDKAWQVATEAFNLAPNGRHVEYHPDGTMAVTNWDHSNADTSGITLQQVDQMFGGFMNIGQDELMKKIMSGEQYRQQSNANLLATKSEPLFNDKGDVIYKAPSGLWGNDGKPQQSFYYRSLNDLSPLSDEDVKGYKPKKVIDAQQGIKKGGLELEGQRLDNQKTQADVANANTISPNQIVTGGNGKQGVVQRGEGGGLTLNPVQGGVQQPAGNKPSTADQKYNSQVAIQNFMGKYGLSEGMDGSIQGPDMTEPQARAAMVEAQQAGLNIYFEHGTREDVGSKWNPMDNKDVPVYRIRAIAPAQAGGVQMQPPTGGQPQQANTGGWRQWAGGVGRAGQQPTQAAPTPRQAPAQQPARPPQQQAPPAAAQGMNTGQQQLSHVTVDANGTLWARKPNGAIFRMVKPNPTIYNGQYANPEYQRYQQLLRQYGYAGGMAR